MEHMRDKQEYPTFATWFRSFFRFCIKLVLFDRIVFVCEDLICDQEKVLKLNGEARRESERLEERATRS